jgi:hypothetical protein
MGESLARINVDQSNGNLEVIKAERAVYYATVFGDEKELQIASRRLLIARGIRHAVGISRSNALIRAALE